MKNIRRRVWTWNVHRGISNQPVYCVVLGVAQWLLWSGWYSQHLPEHELVGLCLILTPAAWGGRKIGQMCVICTKTVTASFWEHPFYYLICFFWTLKIILLGRDLCRCSSFTSCSKQDWLHGGNLRDHFQYKEFKVLLKVWVAWFPVIMQLFGIILFNLLFYFIIMRCC